MVLIKQEVRRLASQWPNGSPMYPGEWLLTWAKVGATPWSLVSIEAFKGETNADV